MIIALVGPTGVGKTNISIELAKKYNAQIIGCDSMQVYKELNIGTGKIKIEEKQGITHHMIDIFSINNNYSVYDYQKDARKILNDLIKQDINIIIVGGTGLYLKSLLYDYKFEKNKKYKDYSDYTNEQLFNMALKKDENLKININNRQRLESFLNSGNTLSKQGEDLLYDAVIIGLTKERSELYESINNRVDKMIDEGLVEEARKLYISYPNSLALNTAIGYKEFTDYFNNKLTLLEVTNKIKKNSRNYAKRQYTWFNNQMSVKWFSIDNNDSVVNKIIKYVDNKE